MLTERVEDKAPDALVFPAPNGGYLRNRNWRQRSGFDDAVAALGLQVTPHDLRRTFGSLARAAGADLRWIQKAMGHESITTTARIYAHLYDDELDSVAAALDRIGREGRGVAGTAYGQNAATKPASRWSQIRSLAVTAALTCGFAWSRCRPSGDG